MDRGEPARVSGSVHRTGMIRICFHGAESTGKSVLAARLEREMGIAWVPEYGREWAERHGADFPMDVLLEIARGQDAAMRRAAKRNPPLLILDTDPLMTAAWALMLHGAVPEELLGYEKAELYLLFDADVPWVADGTRYFGTPAARTRFADAAEQMLVRAAVPYQRISGDWEARAAQVKAIITAALP
jgi:NadR type nicotinamide-nucleotide adenylyltransferase